MLKTLKKKVIAKFCQAYADSLFEKLKLEITYDDKSQYYMTLEQAAKLNAYCIVFHDIYLD